MKPANSAKRAKRAKADARSSKPAKKVKGAGKANKAGKGGKSKAAGRPKSQPVSMQNSRGKVSPHLEGTIAYAKPTVGRQEQQAAAQLVRSGNMGTGPEVSMFEAEFCRLFGLPDGHAVAVVNGTVALYLALRALGACGNDVALPAYGYKYLRAATAMAGGREKVCDIGEDSVHLDIDAAIASGARIAIVSHLFGLPCDLKDYAEEIDIVEDCRDALGARVEEDLVGLQGKLGTFSFGVDEIITAGGYGGMVISRQTDLLEQIRSDVATFDLHMSDLQAAIGRVQLAKLPNLLARREEIFNEYVASGFTLLDVDEQVFDEETAAENRTPNGSGDGDTNQTAEFTAVRYRAVLRSNDAEAVVEKLAQGMIEARIPICEADLLGSAEKNPNASDMSISTVAVPIYPHLSNAEVIEIAEQLAAVMAELVENN
ncbi:MAG: DegT/DnrJ/EryC1/StrS family aminotransferase [Cyanobacteria bacterium REEB67]|nr:DegT/DnrJ/EryC1/StrS family aminotransferase [Cyanobacteria bacterium REEB67]